MVVVDDGSGWRNLSFCTGNGTSIATPRVAMCFLFAIYQTCLLEHRIQLARGKVAVQVRSWGEAHICL
jgi:hypothetical protein